MRVPRALHASIGALLAGLSGASGQLQPVGAGPVSSWGFVENAGQWATPLQFVASHGELIIAVDSAGFFVRMPAAGDIDGLRFDFDGTSASTQLVADRRLPGVRHYFIGAGETNWRRDIRAYELVRWVGVREGVDVILSSCATGIRMRIEVAAGAQFDGLGISLADAAGRLQRRGDGVLVVEASAASMWWSVPRAWQLSNTGAEVHCDADWRLAHATGIALAVPQRDRMLALVVETGLEWATFLGGGDLDFVQDSMLSPDGRIIFAGHTWSANFPVTTHALDGDLDGTRDAFVAAIDPATMTLEFATYLGGSGIDEARALGVQGDRILVTGTTTSTGFPSTPGAFDESHSGFGTDAFVAELANDGSQLVFSTFLGAGDPDTPFGLAMAENGDVVVAGTTASPDYPVTPGALQHPFAGNDDAFVTRLRADGAALVWSATYGGSAGDGVQGVCLAANEDVVLCGGTGSPDFPYSASAWQQGGDSPYVLRLSRDASTVLASTAFGGTLPSSGSENTRVVRIDPLGNIVVAGQTTQFDFPTTSGVFQPQAAGSVILDGFIIAFDPTLSTLTYSSYLGGPGQDGIHDLVFDAAGGVLVAGTTQSSSFPVTIGCLDDQANLTDAFVSRLSPGCKQLWYSTYLGGTSIEKHQGLINDTPLAITPDGGVIIAHYTNSPDYPVTPGAVQATFGGGGDVAVAKLTLLPLGCERYGTPTLGAVGELTIGVTAMPQIGSLDFAIVAGAAPPSSSQGLLLLGLAQAPIALHAAGVEVWIDLSKPYFLASVTSDEIGSCQRRLSIPAVPELAGLSAFAQFLWKDPSSSGGPSASRGLAITIQP